MKIHWIPLYGPEGASSRIRVYTLRNALLGYGVEPARQPDADVLVVQKHLDSTVLNNLATFKGLKVYDFDDVMDLSKVRADLFTTDTDLHRAGTTLVNCRVVPDSIDLCPLSPMPLSDGRYIVWFGHSSNLTDPIRARLKQFVSEGLKPMVISNSHPEIEGVAFQRWELNRFASDLRKFARFAFLSHEGQDQGKSNNKMLLAIAHGVPCVTEHSTAYRALEREMGVRVGMDREEWLRIAQPYVWENYHPSVIAKRFLATIKEYM